jgi:hypothetical protein
MIVAGAAGATTNSSIVLVPFNWKLLRTRLLKIGRKVFIIIKRFFKPVCLLLIGNFIWKYREKLFHTLLILIWFSLTSLDMYFYKRRGNR